MGKILAEASTRASESMERHLITQKKWNAKLRELRNARERIRTLEAVIDRQRIEEDRSDAEKWRNYVKAHQLT